MRIEINRRRDSYNIPEIQKEIKRLNRKHKTNARLRIAPGKTYLDIDDNLEEKSSEYLEVINQHNKDKEQRSHKNKRVFNQIFNVLDDIEQENDISTVFESIKNILSVNHELNKDFEKFFILSRLAYSLQKNESNLRYQAIYLQELRNWILYFSSNE